MSLTATIRVNEEVIGYIEAVRTYDGVDGVHTYKWIWGIDHEGRFLKMDAGDVQHRETDGAFKLVAAVLEKIRGRKADK
jgi:hypothetical protein